MVLALQGDGLLKYERIFSIEESVYLLTTTVFVEHNRNSQHQSYEYPGTFSVQIQSYAKLGGV